MRPMLSSVVVGFLALTTYCAPAAESAAPDHGLAVVVPATEAAPLIALSKLGQVCVQGVALDEKTHATIRAGLQQSGLYGVVTVVRSLDKSLPYADNLVNDLRVDCDACGANAPTDEEILRVVVPRGRAHIKRANSWRTLVKPRPVDTDEWTHFDYDAGGSGVSRDKRIAPPNHVQWRCELQEYWELGGNPASYRPYTGFRLAGERAFFLLNANPTKGKSEKDGPTYIVARDAYNGLPIWQETGYSAGSGTPQENQFVVAPDRVVTFTDRDEFPVALSAASGEKLVAYDQGIKLPPRNDKTPAGYTMLRLAGATLIETGGGKLHALNAKTGARLWTVEEPDGAICFPRVLERERRVLAEVVEADAVKIQGRWGNLKVSSILCVDLDTGKVIWRSRDVAGIRLGQTIQSGNRIFGFCPSGIGANENSKEPIGLVVCLDAETGRLVWKGNHFPWGYNLLVRDGTPFFATPDTLNQVDPATGAISPLWRAGYNNRCNRTAATEDWLIMGLGIFVDREGTATVRSIARSGCAQGAFPANGLLYYTPNTCHCITMLRGHLALSAEPVQEPLADRQRLQPGSSPQSATVRPTALTGPIAAEWRVQINNGETETPPVRHGSRSFVAVIHEHRLECRAEDRVVWSFTANGRISQPPVVHAGNCYFGSHDGSIYCVRAEDGALQWRFLAAPSPRQFVSHGQLESSWPVYNVVLHQGAICGSAGLHPEVGGGLWVWGLDPVSGKILWRKSLKRSPLTGKSGLKIAPNRVLNSPLVLTDDKLSLVGIAFTPDEPDSEIQARIDQGSLGDKNRNWSWSPRGTAARKQ